LSLYACTTVGGTRYLDEWLQSIKTLSPTVITVAQDRERSEPLLNLPDIQIIPYSIGKPWESYDLRHKGYVSDYSICSGIIALFNNFLERNETHLLHIDSDIVLDPISCSEIRKLDWNFLKLCTPAISRERQHMKGVQPTRFWDSSNFGVAREVAQSVYSELRKILNNPYPVDINIQNVIRSCKPSKSRTIESPDLAHYIGGRKWLLSQAK